MLSKIVFKEGVEHFGYGCYVKSLELYGVVMVQAIVKIVKEREMNHNKSTDMSEAVFIFMKVINYWLKEGIKYVTDRGRD